MFHLNFNPEISSEKINHQQDVLFIGSCFSEHISKKLIDLKFSIDSNPFGIVFHKPNNQIMLAAEKEQKLLKA